MNNHFFLSELEYAMTRSDKNKAARFASAMLAYMSRNKIPLDVATVAFAVTLASQLAPLETKPAERRKSIAYGARIFIQTLKSKLL